MKDKQGNEITRKEFMQRWKQGIEGITPLQQTTTQIKSTWIIIFGLLAGIIISIMNLKTLWWLLIILTGGLGNTAMQIIGLYQKKFQLKRFEEMQGGLNE